MRILILCNDFPPLNSIGAQRPYSWFTHFKKFGIEPTVITKNWTGTISIRQDALKSTGENKIVIETDEKGKIIRVPVQTILPEKLIIKYGENTFVLLRRMLTFFYKLLSFISFRFDKHSGIYFQAKELLLKESFDALLITGEPFILFRYGYLLSKEYKIPWVADYRDGWKLNHVTAHQKNILNRILQWWEFRFERKFIRSAKFLTTVDPILANATSNLLKKDVEAIYNGFDDFYKYQSHIKSNSNKLILVHTGTLTPGQRVEFLLQAIKELHEEKKIRPTDIELRFIGIEYFPVQFSRILNFAKSISSYIVTTKRLTREKALEENSQADFLVSLTEKNVKGIYAKTYDYIAMKKPILVLPDDESILSSLVKKLNVGYSFSTVEGLKNMLLESIQLKKRGQLDGVMKIDIEAARFYTRKKQTEILAEILKKRIEKIV